MVKVDFEDPAVYNIIQTNEPSDATTSYMRAGSELNGSRVTPRLSINNIITPVSALSPQTKDVTSLATPKESIEKQRVQSNMTSANATSFDSARDLKDAQKLFTESNSEV